jgi:hypothetical protein
MKKIISLLLSLVFLFTFISCSKVDRNYGVTSEPDVSSEASSVAKNDLPEIMTLDQKMANYFDTSLFDEENYANVYLDKKFKFNAVFDGCVLSVPEKMEKLMADGWKLCKGSDYDADSLIFAKETVSLNFVNESGAKLWALFYNSSNSSVKLLKCNIVKFRIENNYFENPANYDAFNINNITNTTAITDVIDTLGTPSHFYQVDEDDYYLDYFLSKRDRRNKIRVYIDLSDDCVSAIEFSYYK